MILSLYQFLTGALESALDRVLHRRTARGKEDPARLPERRGISSRERPEGLLIWLHAASVGEARSALILIDRLLALHPDLHILVTTGTLTSARMLRDNLPERAFHQFYPLDVPSWTARFLDHWRPDGVLWMESELWPNMILALKERRIPAALVNGRLSDKSFRIWKIFRKTAGSLLESFTLILAQTDRDAGRFSTLGARQVVTTGNLKYSATPLPFNEADLNHLRAYARGRPLWLFASTHEGEETLACRVHDILKNTFPDLLTILVPRHPDRRSRIKALCESHGLNTMMRGEAKALPNPETEIYVADTMGELGLFYRLAPVACIGRSFSDDGGGGHNPIEAAQLHCAVLHGPRVQYQRDLYREMHEADAALKVEDEQALAAALRTLLSDPVRLEARQAAGLAFSRDNDAVIGRVMETLLPVIEKIIPDP
ncbi:MAG: 3-deoxy-D-manno-octulosonic acid transferase [Alphaproteobacteria bacterium]|nr:3-deoxy-D-manno-octulosonic acid transferase [Alphaproteobacteria bacterium]